MTGKKQEKELNSEKSHPRKSKWTKGQRRQRTRGSDCRGRQSARRAVHGVERNEVGMAFKKWKNVQSTEI